MILAIDIGGSTIHLGLVSGSEIVKKSSIRSFQRNASLEETLSVLKSAIADIITPEVESIGIGVPSLVNAEKGIVYDAGNIPSWKEVHLKEAIEERFGRPVKVNNDANCYALGVYERLGGKYSSLACITLGTGTGLGLVLNGHLYEGAHCGAGELCSIPYLDADYETYCSKKFFTAHGSSPRKVSERAEAGDPEAKALMDEFGAHIGDLIAAVMYSYDPNCIAIGGGIANSYGQFEPSMRKAISKRYVYTRFLEGVKIVALPDENIQLFGASQL